MDFYLTDGTTTLELSGDGGAYRGMTYFPTAPDGSPQESMSDSGELIVTGTSAAIVDATREISRLFALARKRQETGSGDRVYVQYRAYTGATLYRSEVLSGRLEYSQVPGARQVTAGTVKVLIDFERRPYWEENALQTVVDGQSMSNGATGISIAGSAVGGTLSTPAVIEITTNVNVWWDRFWIWNNIWNHNGTQLATLPGATISWDNPTDTIVHSWTVAGTELDKMKGDRFRLLALFDRGGLPMPSNVLWSAGLRYSVTEVSRTGVSWTGAGNTKDVFDLGALAMPPGGHYAPNSDLTLSLWMTAAGAGSVDLNRLAFVVGEPGQFRKLEQIGYQALSGDKMVDDSIEGLAYLERSGRRLSLISTVGQALYLWPDQQQYFHCVYDEVTQPGYTPSRSFTVTIRCRPRVAVI